MSGSKVLDNERWKIDGDCRKCRRLSYCEKECKKHKEAVKKAFEELIKERDM